ncbi:hypothetical protein BASA62_003692 [Batrachochytrium salamandrivorans]|nr:hypothetical protein BASA62_003692 [Batrachochytrium salamandrivorans]
MQDSNNGMGVEMELDDIDSDSDSDCTVSESISSDDSYIEDDCGGIDLGSIYAISLGFEAFPVFIRGTLAEQQALAVDGSWRVPVWGIGVRCLSLSSLLIHDSSSMI